MKLISESVCYTTDPDRVVVRLEIEVSGEHLAVSRSAWVGPQGVWTRDQYHREINGILEREKEACRQYLMQEIEKRIFG